MNMSLLARGIQHLSRNISRSAGDLNAQTLTAFYHKNVSITVLRNCILLIKNYELKLKRLRCTCTLPNRSCSRMKCLLFPTFTYV